MPTINKQKLTISKAKIKQLDQLCDLEQNVFDYDQMSRDSFRRLIKSNAESGIFVALKNSQVVGYIVIFTRINSRKARIYSLAVHPDFRGQGIALQLMNHGNRYCKRLKKSAIYLEVRTNNQKAIKLYKSLGFKKVGVKLNYYTDGGDAFCYERAL